MNCSVVNRNVIEGLLLGAAPERKSDVHALWANYDPMFWVCDDASGILFQARWDRQSGEQRIEFTERGNSLLWLIGFTAWKVFQCYSPFAFLGSIMGIKINDSFIAQDCGFADAEAAFEQHLYAVKCLQAARSVTDIDWPSDIPKPQACAPADPQDHATFDLTCIATAYVYLHEVRHVKFSKDGQRPTLLNEEELACDVFAREFLLAKTGTYCEASREPFQRVMTKRAMGVALGAFAVYLLTPRDGHGGTDEYPPIGVRLQALIGEVNLPPDSDFWIFTGALLICLLRLRDRTVNVNFSNAKDLVDVLMKELDVQHGE